jgi:hypothetical protein
MANSAIEDRAGFRFVAGMAIELQSPNGTPVNLVDRRVERAAANLGIQANEVERLPFDLSALEGEGLFCDVDVRNFGLLDRRLDWRALGITLPARGGVAFRPPRCGLIPDHYRLPLLRPASRAHTALHRFSYRFRLVETVFEQTGYRWIPWRAWSTFEEEFDRARDQLDAAHAVYEAHHASIREIVFATFRQLAADSARRLQASGQSVPGNFEQAVLDEVATALPTPDLLRERLSLRYRVGVLHLGSELIAEQRKAAEERARLELVQTTVRLERDRADAERRAVQAELWAQQDRPRRQGQAEEEDRRREAAVKERLRQLKLDAARERLQETLSPLEEGARQLHTAVFETATALRASLQKHQALRGSSARKARQLAKWFSAMNWVDDQQLDSLVRELEVLASTPTGKNRKRDPGPIDHVLGDIIQLTYSNTQALAEPSRMAALEL